MTLLHPSADLLYVRTVPELVDKLATLRCYVAVANRYPSSTNECDRRSRLPFCRLFLNVSSRAPGHLFARGLRAGSAL